MAETLNERLVVRNFGPITDMDIVIRPLTMFIGTQGSGKSTVSKLLTICRDLRWWLQLLEDAKSDEVMKPFYDFSINDYFEENSYFYYTVNGHSVKYEDGNFSFVSEIWGIKEVKDFIAYSASKANYSPASPLIGVDDNLAQTIQEANARMILYNPAERNLVGNLSEATASLWSAGIPLPRPLLEYMGLFERATKLFPRYEIPFFGVDFVKQGNKNMVELRDKHKLLPLYASASGLQSAIPMLMIIDYALKSGNFDAFVIEEPEQNLFPENQNKILNFIASKFWTKKQCQFIITTHSPYLLSSLNVLMLAYKLHGYEDYREQVEGIVKPEFMVNPDDVAAYSLNPNDEDGIYCKSLISEKTGMVSVNALDTASIYIGDEFDRLYRLYVKMIKGKK